MIPPCSFAAKPENISGMKRWAFGILSLLFGCLATFLAVIASELHTENSRDVAYICFYFAATGTIAIAVLLLRFAIKRAISN